MDFELQAVTKEGATLVERCESHVDDFASRADGHDREGTFPTENFEALKESRVLAAAIPEQFGGLGVESLHDMLVGVSRLARGCPSTAIAANMHMGTMWCMARMWREAPPETAALLEAMLPVYGASQVVVCAAGTERGTSVMRPRTTATRTDDGWRIDGHKIFGTNAEIAGGFAVFCRTTAEDGREHLASGFVPADAPGVEVRRTWDSLGMRASCSHDVVFDGCVVPDEMIQLGGLPGEPDAAAAVMLAAVNFPLLGAYIGIAEAARGLALEAVQGDRRPDLIGRPAVTQLVAEIEVDLFAAGAAISRAARLVDEAVAEGGDVLTPWQCAKVVLMPAVQRVVDNAMHVAGGASYMSGHRLSRLYRDVRAGWFHQPFGRLEAYDFVGRRALGLDTSDLF